MGERRSGRGLPPRNDTQILGHAEDIHMLRAIGAGRVVVTATNRIQLRRLAREDLVLGGFGSGVPVTLLARGERIVAAAREESASPGP